MSCCVFHLNHRSEVLGSPLVSDFWLTPCPPLQCLSLLAAYWEMSLMPLACVSCSPLFTAWRGFIRFLCGTHMSNSLSQVEIWFSLGNLQKMLKPVIESKVLMLQGCTSQPCKAPQGSLSPAQMRFTLCKDSSSVLEEQQGLWSSSWVLHATTTPGYLSTWAPICIHSLMNLKSSYCTLPLLRRWRMNAAGYNFLCICKTGEQPPAKMKMYCKKSSAVRTLSLS